MRVSRKGVRSGAAEHGLEVAFLGGGGEREKKLRARRAAQIVGYTSPSVAFKQSKDSRLMAQTR